METMNKRDYYHIIVVISFPHIRNHLTVTNQVLSMSLNGLVFFELVHNKKKNNKRSMRFQEKKTTYKHEFVILFNRT
jgi:hypothetical protein